MSSFDLLSTIEYGGCSVKLPAGKLSETLKGLPGTPHPNLLVDIETHDDAGVYKINDELALIQTTDFFPPVCSDPYEFGQIAAANALSDVYAMGGKILTAMNIVAFPASIPLDVLKEILHGGIDKLIEAGGVMMGGHTIVDDIPKYGLAVTGTGHPEKNITNSNARPGDVLILTKPIGAGIILAGKRLGEISQSYYQTVLESMKQLNTVADLMQKYNVKSATDITGFGLAGHALKLAMASKVCIKINPEKVPLFDGAKDLAKIACLPGACFRNLEYVENNIEVTPDISFEHKMLMMDAQTSGGILMCCPPQNVQAMLLELYQKGFIHASVIGEVTELKEKHIVFSAML